MDSKKKLTIDFDLYISENQENINRGFQEGYNQAMRTVIHFIQKNPDLKDFFKDGFTQEWGLLLVALGKEKEWKEFIDYHNQQQEKKPESKDEVKE